MIPVSVSGLVRDFGDVRALDGVSFSVEAGSVVALLGHNGAGKTTTLRHLTGLLAPTEGTVRVFGADPVTDGPAVRRRTGVLPAAPAVDDHLTGRENLELAVDLWDVDPSTGRARTDELLAAFDLVDRAGERAAGYSSGMRQRLALARVLVHEPELLLLDEPTAALDPVATHDVRELLRALASDERRTVVLCTHDLDEAARIADRVVILDHGRIVADGSPADLARGLGTGALAVDVDDPAAAARLLDGAVTGSTVTVPGIARDAVPGLVARLVEAGIAVYRVEPREPTLEDIYLALHGRAP